MCRVPEDLRQQERLHQHRLRQAGDGADAGGGARDDAGRDARRAHVLPHLHLQLLLHHLHHGHLPPPPRPPQRGGAAAGGAAVRARPGRHLRGLDPHHPGEL